MLLFTVLGLFPTFLDYSDAYVLLQVRKQDNNQTNVDALIHRVVPSEKFDKLAQMMQQKERAEVTDDDVRNNQGLAIPAHPASQTKSRHFVAESTKEPEFSDLIELVKRKFRKSPAGTVFRSRSEEVVFQPAKVRLNNGQSSVYSINPDTIVGAMKDLLSSVTFRKYVDKLTRKAAIAYKEVENDFHPLSLIFNKDSTI